MKETIYLKDVVDIMRSKNAGPYMLTFDLFFKSEDFFNKAVNSPSFNKNNIARLFNIDTEDVHIIQSYKPALGIKITIKRKIPSGAVGDTDIYGAQQHAPLLDMLLD